MANPIINSKQKQIHIQEDMANASQYFLLCAAIDIEEFDICFSEPFQKTRWPIKKKKTRLAFKGHTQRKSELIFWHFMTF